MTERFGDVQEYKGQPQMISPKAKRAYKARHMGSSSSWRYGVIKRYKHRAQHFVEESQSLEERGVWLKVVAWFDSILAKKYLKETGSLGLPYVYDEDLKPTLVVEKLVEG